MKNPMKLKRKVALALVLVVPVMVGCSNNEDGTPQCTVGHYVTYEDGHPVCDHFTPIQFFTEEFK